MKLYGHVLIVLCLLAAFSPQIHAQEEAAVYTITINYVVQNVGQHVALDSYATIMLFDNLSGWADQEIIDEEITVDGKPVWPQISSTEDNRWATISLGNLDPGESVTISVVQVLKVNSVKFSIDPEMVGTTFPSEVTVYTTPVEGLYESNSPEIENLAQELTGTLTNPYYKARRIFEWLLENMDYEPQTTEHSALWGYQARKGDCTEFSNLFVALARAAGIPAKSVSGYGYLTLYTTEAGADIQTLGHAWAIFYLPGYGWVPADAVWPQYVGSFGEIDHAHIAGASTGGEGVVDEHGQIVWHSPGYIERRWNVDEPTELGGQVSGSIIPQVLVSVDLQTSPVLENDTLTLTATIKNLGQNPVSNLTAGLEADPSYFEVMTPPRQKSFLASGDEWQTSFKVQLKENAYCKRHVFTSRVSYESMYSGLSGTFSAEGKASVSIPEKPVQPSQIFDLMLFALLGVLVAALVTAGVALARG